MPVLDAALFSLKRDHSLSSLWNGRNRSTYFETTVGLTTLRVTLVVRDNQRQLLVEARTPGGFGREYTPDVSEAGLLRMVDLLNHRLGR